MMRAAVFVAVAMACGQLGADVGAQAQQVPASGVSLPAQVGARIKRVPQAGQWPSKSDQAVSTALGKSRDQGPVQSTAEVTVPIKHDQHEMAVALQKAAVECQKRIELAVQLRQPKPDCADKQ